MLLLGCQFSFDDWKLRSTLGTEDCQMWYHSIDVTPVSAINNGNEGYKGWYIADFLDNEMNFQVHFYLDASHLYSECKTMTMIHEILKDSINICTNKYLIVANDTVRGKSNLFKYFTVMEYKGLFILKYNKESYVFPKFEKPENTFYITIKLSDNTQLTDSCVVRIN